MKTIRILRLAVAVVAVLLTGGALRAASPAQAQGVITTLATDMDPKDGGVSYTNDDHTVGAIDPCIEVSAGDTVEFDVVLDAIPPGRDLKGYQYFMGFDDTNLTFTAQTNPSTDCPPADGIEMICRAATSCTGFLGCVYTGEGVPEPPDSGSPASPGVHDVFIVDSTVGATVGAGSDPYGTAGGVLGRYNIAVSGTAPSGLYGIGLNDSVVYGTALADTGATDIWDRPETGIDEDSDGAVDEDILLDRTVGYGLIAVDVPCGAPPTPTPTPIRTPMAVGGIVELLALSRSADSSGHNYIALAGAAAAGAIAVAAGAWYARRRRPR